LLQLTRSRTVTIVGVFSSAWRWLADLFFRPKIQSGGPIKWQRVDKTNLGSGAQAGKFRESGWGEAKSVNLQEILSCLPAAEKRGVPLFLFFPGSLSCSNHLRQLLSDFFRYCGR